MSGIEVAITVLAGLAIFAFAALIVFNYSISTGGNLNVLTQVSCVNRRGNDSFKGKSGKT